MNFHDLKDPWYSALAQSEAISVLIRYYVLTKDKSVLPLIVKLKNFMVPKNVLKLISNLKYSSALR